MEEMEQNVVKMEIQSSSGIFPLANVIFLQNAVDFII